MRREITIGDLCELTGYSRDQMRGLLSELPRFSKRGGTARVARVYSNHDVLVLVLLCRLESEYGLKRAAVASFCDQVAETLAVPRAVGSGSKLILRFRQMGCDFSEGTPSVEDGLVVALDPIFKALDAYLMPAPIVQRELGLSAVASHAPPKASAGKSANARKRASR